MTSLTSVQNNLCVEQAKVINQHGLDNLVSHFFQVLKKIHHNWHTRRQLKALSDYALKDIGLTKADAFEELNKPLWK